MLAICFERLPLWVTCLSRHQMAFYIQSQMFNPSIWIQKIEPTAHRRYWPKPYKLDLHQLSRDGCSDTRLGTLRPSSQAQVSPSIFLLLSCEKEKLGHYNSIPTTGTQVVPQSCPKGGFTNTIPWTWDFSGGWNELYAAFQEEGPEVRLSLTEETFPHLAVRQKISFWAVCSDLCNSLVLEHLKRPCGAPHQQNHSAFYTGPSCLPFTNERGLCLPRRKTGF